MCKFCVRSILFLLFFLIFISKKLFLIIMKIFIEKDRTKKEIEFCGKVREMLLKIGENPVAVLVTRNDELLSEDEMLKDTDEIKILSVVSGG